MKENSELNRVNYALNKHHRQMLREKIDPRLIERIQVAENPSLNYRRALNAVYHDELEKTVEIQEEKRQQEKAKLNPYSSQSPLGKSKSNPYQFSPLRPLENTLNNELVLQVGSKSNSKAKFMDYEQERSKKFDDFINKNCSGSFLFREQDEYQQKKYRQAQLAKDMLQQQLRIKENRRIAEQQNRSLEVQQVRQNRIRQIEQEMYRTLQRKKENELFGGEIKQQMQLQRLKKGRKSYFSYQNIARHNPITNPIEYHIDNPYILSKYQYQAQNRQ